MSDQDKIKSRNWVSVLYPEDPTHIACISFLEKSGYNYAGILHTEDVYDDDHPEGLYKKGDLKKPHYHLVLTLKNPRFRKPLADELGIEPNYLEVCRNRDSALLYMIHDGFPDKFQYDVSACFGPLADAIPKLLVDDNEASRILQILDILDTMPIPCSYRRFLTRCCELDLYGDFRRMGSGILRLLDEHNSAQWEEKSTRIKCALNNDDFKSYCKAKGGG